MKNSVAIVGAGLTGLTLANLLGEVGVKSVLIEKSKSVGGRMATRRDSSCTFDHGAQFFSEIAPDSFFWQRRWQEQQVSKPWFSDRAKNYFCGVKGMTSLAKNLAVDQNIIFNEKILTVQSSDSGLEIKCESQNVIRADYVVLTAPLPQTLDILRLSKLQYPKALEDIQYAKAIVGLFHIEDELLDINFIKPEGDIYSIASNRSKGISNAEALTVVMNAEFSELHFDHPEETNLSLIESELVRVLKKPILIKSQQLKKWRYSHPTSVYAESVLQLPEQKIILAGDAFGGASLGGAIRSALAAFEKLKQDRFTSV